VAPVDFLIMIFTFLVTVLYNVEAGLEYGIIASVVILLLQIARLGTFSETFHFPFLPSSFPPSLFLFILLKCSNSYIRTLTILTTISSLHPSLPPSLPRHRLHWAANGGRGRDR